MDFFKDNWQFLATTFGGFTATAAGFLYWLAKQSEKGLDEKIRMAVMSTVLESMDIVKGDIADLREKTGALHAQWDAAHDAIGEIRATIARLDGHMQALPQRIVEAIGSRK